MGGADRVEGYARRAGGRGREQGGPGTSQVCGARQKCGHLLRESDEDGGGARSARGNGRDDPERAGHVNRDTWLAVVRETKREGEIRFA